MRRFFSSIVTAVSVCLLAGITSAARAAESTVPAFPEAKLTDTAYYRAYAGYSAMGLGVSIYGDNNFLGGVMRVNNISMNTGWGAGIAWNTLAYVSPLNLRVRYHPPTDYHSEFTFGMQATSIGITGMEFLSLYAGYLYDKWLFELGYSYGGRYDHLDDGSSFFIRAGREFNRTINVDAKEKKVRDPNRPRYFRFGLELGNYSIWLDEVGFLGFDEPPISAGLGFFARIGPEPVYFSTGLYGRIDYFYKEGIVARDLDLPGISFGTLRLLDANMGILSLETPFLLNFGSKQVRFVGGVLLDYFLGGGVELTTNENLPIIGGRPLDLYGIEEELWDAIPGGNMYWVLGLDLDIFRYWGIGAKLLIHNHSFGNYEERFGFEPSKLQIRFSTYFVF